MDPNPGQAPLSGMDGVTRDVATDGFDFEVLRQCLADFPDPALLADCQGRVRFLNDRAQQLFGCQVKQDDPLFCTAFLETESTEKSADFVSQCLATGNLHSVPVRVKNRHGDAASLFATATAITDGAGRPAGCFAVFRDIHADLLADMEIQQRMAVLSSVLDNFPTPFFIVDHNMVITYMNHLLEKLTGYTQQEAVNHMTCAGVLATAQCNTCDCLLKQAMETKSPISGVRRTIVDREGRKIPVVVNASIITDAEGRVIGGFEAIRDITPVVEAEQKIALLTEVSQEGILMVDENQRIIFANSRVAEFLGHPREQLVGMGVSEVLPVQHQEMLTDLVQNVAQEEQQRLQFCTTIQPQDDSSRQYRAFETCVAVSRVGKSVITCMYFRDLTGRIEIERQLRNANSFLQNIIRSSVDGIVVVDTKGNVLMFNEGAERILGYKAEEVVGHPEVFRRFYSPEVARENMRRMRSSEYGPPDKLNSTRVTFVRKDGEPIPVNFSAALIKEGDQGIGSVGIFSDLREHLKIRRELEEAKIKLLQADKIASLGRLAAGVAHEINNPLAGILIYADMLMKDVSHNPQWAQDLEEIINQTLRCKEIVTRLLEFSRQPLGERVAFDVNHLIDRCVKLLSHQPLFHDIQFSHDAQADLPQITGDPGQIQQVFTNLILNAANAMSGNGQLTITSRFDSFTEEVVIKFADTGPGIAPEIMNKIFEPFFTTKAPGDGTGLGLSVVYGIVQQHGGSITVENLANGGALFTVKLPLESPETFMDMIEE